MSRRSFILIVMVVGGVAALIVTMVLLVIDDDDDDDSDPEENPGDVMDLSDEELGLFDDAQAPLVEEFQADWDRYRRATLWVESSVERKRVSDGGLLNSTQIYAQLPPDRIVAGLGATTGMFDGALVNCAGEEIDTATECVTGGTARDYDDIVAEESAARASYFEPGAAAYRLRRDEDGCYGLLLTRAIPTPPYGTTSTFCFDEATGALTKSIVDRQTTIETTSAVDVRTDVTREDLAELIGADAGR